MMILRTSPPSPFGRKVIIAASVLGLAGDITIAKADPSDPADTLRGQNPVGKIPILGAEFGSDLPWRDRIYSDKRITQCDEDRPFAS